MTLIDVKAVQEQARKEISEEVTKKAVEKLKDLYSRREKAQLVLKNIEREIDGYLAEITELTVYESAGVDTGSKL
jgi:hypothetical protein